MNNIKDIFTDKTNNPVIWLLSGIFSGEHIWRLVRIILVLFTLIFFSWLGNAWFNQKFLAIDGRLLVPAIAALLGAFILAANFVQDVFDIPSFGTVLNYFLSSVFFRPYLIFWGYPMTIIENGRIAVQEEQIDLLTMIGGPVNLYVRPGNAVVLESLCSPAKIVDLGWHFVPRFNRVREIIDLREQELTCAPFKATSKDGITITVHDAKYRYCIYRSAHKYERSFEVPYPYSQKAIKTVAFNRSVSKDGLTPWPTIVRFQFEGVIQDFINKKRFDYLTNFQTGDARKELCALMETDGRNRFKNNGAELLWFDIGHFSYDESIRGQRFHNWQTEWHGNTKIELAYGQAQTLAYQELGRAEAQAELLMSILNAFEDVGLSDNPIERKKNIRNLIMIRTAQILENLSAYPSPEQKDTSNGLK